jgi:hypothetical protein
VSIESVMTFAGMASIFCFAWASRARSIWSRRASTSFSNKAMSSGDSALLRK